MLTLGDSIIIGATGGSIAGLTVWAVQIAENKVTEAYDKSRIFNWLKNNTDEEKKEYHPTHKIASWTNLTKERVRYLCSIDKRIFMTEKDNDTWCIYTREKKPNFNVG